MDIPEHNVQSILWTQYAFDFKLCTRVIETINSLSNQIISNVNISRLNSPIGQKFEKFKF